VCRGEQCMQRTAELMSNIAAQSIESTSSLTRELLRIGEEIERLGGSPRKPAEEESEPEPEWRPWNVHAAIMCRRDEDGELRCRPVLYIEGSDELGEAHG